MTTQSTMFSHGEDLPLFTGQPVAVHPATFTPREAHRQLDMFKEQETSTMTYKLVAKPHHIGWDGPEWMYNILDIDRDAEMAQLDDDHNGNVVYEIYSTKDLSSISKVRTVVSLEKQP